MREKREFSFFMCCLIPVLVTILLCITGCGNTDSLQFITAEELPQEEISQETTLADGEQFSTLMSEETDLHTEEIMEEATIYVDVCGAVKVPGVYALKAGSRVYEAVDAAGGFLADAFPGAVNQAQCLEDGQQIYIPTKEETQSTFVLSQNGQHMQSQENKVNINTADVEGLMTLKGIGEAKAEAILAYREEHGGFSSIEELMNVQGIKESTFVKIKDDIMVG